MSSGPRSTPHLRMRLRCTKALRLSRAAGKCPGKWAIKSLGLVDQDDGLVFVASPVLRCDEIVGLFGICFEPPGPPMHRFGRSEERRVGKEGRSRWSPY